MTRRASERPTAHFPLYLPCISRVSPALSGQVVILSDKSKEEMDAEVHIAPSFLPPLVCPPLLIARGDTCPPRHDTSQVQEELESIGAGLNVITREGSPKELNHIDRVCAGTARRIIVLPPTDVGGDDGDESGEASADGVSEATGLALALQRGVSKSQSDRASVVVTAPKGFSAEVASDNTNGFGSYAEVNPEDFISRILAQCSVQPGLSHVYAELLLQGAGQEVYAEPLAKHRNMHGQTFGDASRRFGKAIAIGIVRAPVGGGELGGDEEVILSPSEEELLQPTDSIVLIAKSRRDTAPSRMRAKPRMPIASTFGGVDGVSTPAAKVAAAKEAPPRILLLNLDPSMSNMLEQIDEVAPKGASLTLFCPSSDVPDALPRMRRTAFKHIEGDPSSPAALQKLRAHEYDAPSFLPPVVCPPTSFLPPVVCPPHLTARGGTRQVRRRHLPAARPGLRGRRLEAALLPTRPRAGRPCPGRPDATCRRGAPLALYARSHRLEVGGQHVGLCPPQRAVLWHPRPICPPARVALNLF